MFLAWYGHARQNCIRWSLYVNGFVVFTLCSLWMTNMAHHSYQPGACCTSRCSSQISKLKFLFKWIFKKSVVVQPSLHKFPPYRSFSFPYVVVMTNFLCITTFLMYCVSYSPSGMSVTEFPITFRSLINILFIQNWKTSVQFRGSFNVSAVSQPTCLHLAVL